MTSTNTVAARLPGGRLLIAILDPAVPDHRSPLRHHLRTETPRTWQGPKGLGTAHAATPPTQVNDPPGEQGEEQPGQTVIRAPR